MRRRGVFRPVAASCLSLGCGPAMSATFTETQATLDKGAAALHGTLTMPAAPGRYDAVLVWSGSGPTDRDGNSALGLANNCFRLLAHGLAEAGFASLRTDKRGVAASAAAIGREEDLRFDVFVDDAVRWAGWLAARRDRRTARLPARPQRGRAGRHPGGGTGEAGRAGADVRARLSGR
jgi:hypothetical protein